MVVKNFLVSSGSKNYWGNGSDGALDSTSDVILPSTLDGDVVVKHYTSLKLNAGHLLTVANRCKGLVIYVRGDCTIDGTISMTKKGAAADASSAGDSDGTPGLKFPRFTSNGTDLYAASSNTALNGCGAALINAEANQRRINGNGTIITIARYGATPPASGQAGSGIKGTSSATSSASGGSAGGNGGFGGGGGQGTCWSGGPGGGGGGRTDLYAGQVDGTSGAANGGKGGNGNGGGGTGAGNPAGDITSGSYYGNGTQGEIGTGGTIILFVKGRLTIGATGKIESNGANGGNSSDARDNGGGGGAGSGGGIILLIYNESLTNSGTLEAVGGLGGNGHTSGGAGGDGSIRSIQVSA